MDIKQLRALVTVSDVGSVTKAARLLHLVQPAVSRHIRALEDEVGVALFERTRQGMIPTAAGEILTQRARRALLELERASAEIRPHPERVQGIVTIGLLESLVDVLADPLFEAVSTRHPGVSLRLLTAFSGHLQEWLDDDAVDLTLLYALSSTPTITVVPLLHEPLWAVAPAGAVGREEALSWERLSGEPLVLPVVGHGLRTLIDQGLLALPTPQIILETNSMALQKRLVTAGRGWTVLPAAGAAADIAAGRFSGGPIAPQVTRTVTLARQRPGRASPAVEAVAAELVAVVRRLVGVGAWHSARLADDATESRGP